MPKHVIILGCGRSGTSIFGELFEALPDYTYLSEPDFDDLLGLDFRAPIAVKVPRESKNFPAPAGLSFPLDALTDVMSQKPIVFWQVRHPLDAIASLRVGISSSWGHHPRPKDWKTWLSRPLIERCAHHWVTINKLGYSAVKRVVILSKFETMLSDPLSFAVDICSIIGQETKHIMPRLVQWSERVQNTDNEKFVEAMTSRNHSRPDHKFRVGRWRENLSESEVSTIWPIVSDTASQFGYSLD